MADEDDGASRLAMWFGGALVLWVAIGAWVAAPLRQSLGTAAFAAEAVLTLGLAAALLGLAQATGGAATLRLSGRPAPGWGWPFGLVLLGFLPLVLLTVALSLIAHDRPEAGDIAGAMLFGISVAVVKGVVFWAALRRAAVVRFGVIGGVIAAALAYGAFHLLNLMNGWTLADTLAQAGHAVVAGLLYASLAQRFGVIWPVILLQAVWETQITFWLLSDGPERMAGSAILQLTFPLHLAVNDAVLAFWLPEPALGLLAFLALVLRQRRGVPERTPDP